MVVTISYIRHLHYQTLKNNTIICRSLLGKLVNVKISNFNNFSVLSVKPYALNNHRRSVKIQNYSDDKGSIVQKKEDSEVSTSIKETVKETTKTTFNSLVILAGIGVTGLLFYATFRELFSGKSSNSVYTKAFEKCIAYPKIKDALGEPIKGHGETTRRGRRRHVSHVTYMKDNVEHMRMQFYLKGARSSGTVHLEVIEDASGEYAFRYLFVQLDDYPRRIIVVEDNRQDPQTPHNTPTPLDIDSSDVLRL